MAATAIWSPELEACAEEEEYACALIGCSSQYYLTTTIGLPFEEIDRATYVACRNDECHSVQLEAAEPRKSAETYLRLNKDQPQSEHLIVAVIATDEPGATELRVVWQFAEQPLTDRKSDEYQVTIERDGQGVYTTTQSVSEYFVSQPNGPRCEPTCYQARSAPTAADTEKRE